MLICAIWACAELYLSHKMELCLNRDMAWQIATHIFSTLPILAFALVLLPNNLQRWPSCCCRIKVSCMYRILSAFISHPVLKPRPITIHQLLIHTSGIPSYTGLPNFVATMGQ